MAGSADVAAAPLAVRGPASGIGLHRGLRFRSVVSRESQWDEGADPLRGLLRGEFGDVDDVIVDGGVVQNGLIDIRHHCQPGTRSARSIHRGPQPQRGKRIALPLQRLDFRRTLLIPDRHRMLMRMIRYICFRHRPAPKIHVLKIMPDMPKP